MRTTSPYILPIIIITASSCNHTNTAPNSTQPITHDTIKSKSSITSSHLNHHLNPDSLISTHKDTLPPTQTHATSSPPTSKELDRLSDTITRCFQSLAPDNPLRQNLNSWYTTLDAVVLSLNINTPYWQDQCRQHLSASPYIKFSGPSKPEKINITPTTDPSADSIILRPDLSSYPADSSTISFTLTNNTNSTLTFGDPYTVAYRSTDSTWYELPYGGIWNEIGYALQTGGSHTFTVRLRPQLNHNKPGLYRLYKKVQFEHSTQPFWIMTEFHLH